MMASQPSHGCMALLTETPQDVHRKISPCQKVPVENRLITECLVYMLVEF